MRARYLWRSDTSPGSRDGPRVIRLVRKAGVVDDAIAVDVPSQRVLDDALSGFIRKTRDEIREYSIAFWGWFCTFPRTWFRALPQDRHVKDDSRRTANNAGVTDICERVRPSALGWPWLLRAGTTQFCGVTDLCEGVHIGEVLFVLRDGVVAVDLQDKLRVQILPLLRRVNRVGVDARPRLVLWKSSSAKK